MRYVYPEIVDSARNDVLCSMCVRTCSIAFLPARTLFCSMVSNDPVSSFAIASGPIMRMLGYLRFNVLVNVLFPEPFVPATNINNGFDKSSP